eukprot:4194267-Prymnesium_polylepis.1
MCVVHTSAREIVRSFRRRFCTSGAQRAPQACGYMDCEYSAGGGGLDAQPHVRHPHTDLIPRTIARVCPGRELGGE